jgi:D-alanyl-lipoteichoic acid acyltransferase DltB (MBOAT superfamily)
MFIGGLWHAASWKFVAWGGLHGIALAAERFFKQFVKLPQNIFTRIIGIILTFHFISFCWIFFRAKDFSTAIELIEKIGQVSLQAEQWLSILSAYKNVLIVMLAGFFMHFLPSRFVQWLQRDFIQTSVIVKALIIGMIFWLVYAIASSEVQPFIYFQF